VSANWRVTLARWLLQPTGLEPRDPKPVDLAIEELNQLDAYVRHSGHLAHRYHASKRVRGHVARAIACLDADGVKIPLDIDFSHAQRRGTRLDKAQTAPHSEG